MEAKRNIHEVMTQAAGGLHDRLDVQTTMQEAVDLAVRDIAGADGAALSIVQRHKRVSTPAASHESARHADELQYATGEGPCLSAVWDQPLVQVASIADERRWPAWSAAMSEQSGYRSVLVVRLFTTADRLGALNLYSNRRDAFDEADVEQAEALAAHIAVAIHSAREIEGLGLALDGRTVISQAQGILMERYQLDAAGAFAVLTRTASHSNRKLRDIAQEIVETRRLPEQGQDPMSEDPQASDQSRPSPGAS